MKFLPRKDGCQEQSDFLTLSLISINFVLCTSHSVPE